MRCLSSSSLIFGILLVVKASFAQSAPYFYQDSNEDEEALIDKLASLAAAVGSQQLPKQRTYPNYGDFPGYGELSDDLLPKQYLPKLPPQFGYRPDDIRFYLPAEQFPQLSSDGNNNKAESDYDTPRSRIVKQEEQREPDQIQIDNSIPVMAGDEVPSGSVKGQEEQEVLVPYIMKKNEVKEIQPADHSRDFIAEPSNMLSSGQSVDRAYHIVHPIDDNSVSYSDIYYIGLIAGCSAAIVIGVVAAGIFWYRIHQRVKAAAEVEYPAYGVTGPMKSGAVSPSGGDRKLAQSAQMYHYQHQKQQMAALQKGALQGDQENSAHSDVESEEDNDDDNDYTVYECPGLAPAGEMEVKNPLFQDETTPATPQLKSEDEK